MNYVNLAGRMMMAAFLVFVVTACGKKKNGSAAASAPVNSCTMNQYGQYVNASGVQCAPTSQCTLGANGQYVNSLGQLCSPYPQNPGYPTNYSSYQQQGYGCDAHYYTYGIRYVPVILSGQLQCVRYDLLQPYAQQIPQYASYYVDYGYDYYYAYPPYEGTGAGCLNVPIGGGISASLCF